MWSSGPSQDSLESLVAKVKELQRSSPDAKEQWGAYADQQGGGTRDPSKHNPEFLQGFLNHVSSGHRLTPNQSSSLGGWGKGAPSEQNPTLADSIKTLQKRSEAFKDAWAKYCTAQGGGKFDPSKHNAEFLLQFLAQLAGGPGLSGGGSMGGEPSMKRIRGSAGAGGGGSSGDPKKDELVARIKAFQKDGVEQKELWSLYADTYLEGWRDPSRHDANALDQFCSNHDVPKLDASAASAGLGGYGPTWPPHMAGKGQMLMDPIKESLVNRIKAFQKLGRENADNWLLFCGPTKDPKLHDIAKLQEYCKIFAVP